MTHGRKIALTLVVMSAVAAFAGAVTYSSFTAAATNGGNVFSSGTVAIGDNDGGGAVLTLANALPGHTDTGCIRVTYTGSLSSRVRLFGTVTGALAPYLTLTITRGADPSPSFKSCTNLTADSTVYVGGQPAGVVWTGPLSTFPATWDAGIVDPSPASPESWATSEAHSYRFVITLENNVLAEGQSATAAFTWEARNE